MKILGAETKPSRIEQLLSEEVRGRAGGHANATQQESVDVDAATRAREPVESRPLWERAARVDAGACRGPPDEQLELFSRDKLL